MRQTHCVLTDYVKITEVTGCVVYVCIWYCGLWTLTGWNYRLSVSVFGRK